MSYERALAALRLEMPEAIPHCEYVSNRNLIFEMTGLDIDAKSGKKITVMGEEYFEEVHLAFKKFYEMTDQDFFWHSEELPLKGRTTSMGHAEFLEGGTDFNDNIFCPFKTADDVLNFDPVAEYGLPDVDECVKKFQGTLDFNRKEFPMGLWPGGYYHTLFSACITAFGWEMFLSSAPLDEERFDRVLEGFYERTRQYYNAWVKTDIEFFICHDDIVWTRGAVFHPDWYREHIFPRYKKLWAILKESDIKVLFCSDGNFTEFVDDLAEAGADGFIFEPCTDLELIASKYGKTHVMIGNVDCRNLTFGTRQDIYNDVKRCADIGKDCPGYFFSVGNHIPSNVPPENAIYYFELIKELGKR